MVEEEEVMSVDEKLKALERWFNMVRDIVKNEKDVKVRYSNDMGLNSVWKETGYVSIDSNGTGTFIIRVDYSGGAVDTVIVGGMRQVIRRRLLLLGEDVGKEIKELKEKKA